MSFDENFSIYVANKNLTQTEKYFSYIASLLTSDSWLILTAVDHNLNFHIFKCFDCAQWFVNAKKHCPVLTLLSPIHAQLNIDLDIIF